MTFYPKGFKGFFFIFEPSGPLGSQIRSLAMNNKSSIETLQIYFFPLGLEHTSFRSSLFAELSNEDASLLENSPGAGFVSSTKEFEEIIQENKDLLASK